MKILLIEDHKMLAQCLKADFESQGCTIHIADSVKKAEAELKNNDYDLILMDINLSGYGKGENGLDVSEKFIKIYGAKILILTGYDRGYYRERAESIGCYGFISKEETTEKLMKIMKAVVEEDKKYFFRSQKTWEDLTAGELKILRLYAVGKSRREVAEECFISTSSLAVILNRIYEKLDVKNYQEMVQRARTIGYIDSF